MRIHPCPCMSLQKGSMTLAILDAIVSVLNFGLMTFVLVQYINDDTDEDLTKSEKNIGIVVTIVLMVVCVLQTLLALRLYYGAKNGDYKNCRIWIFATTVGLIINIVSLIVSNTASDFDEETFGGTLFNILYKLYEITVVYCFLDEMRGGNIEPELQMNSYPASVP